MNHFEIYGAIGSLAEERGWIFIPGIGNSFEENYQASRETIGIGQMIVTCVFVPTPTFIPGRISKVSYQGSISLGRKFDPDGGKVNLDESFAQKLANRLEEMQKLVAQFAIDIACQNKLVLSGSTMPYMINRYDECIDFVDMGLTFTQGI